ncbi:4489_t:CDS:1, partial [Cetraspora pellucida]
TYHSGDFLLCEELSSEFICHIHGIVINEVDRTYKVKVDWLLQNKNLPNYRSNSIRHTRGDDKELWLVEGDPIFIDPVNINRHVVVWLCDLPTPENYEFYVKKIVYYFDDHWKYRDIIKRYQLP